jgi:hypothetical protein
VDCDGGEGGGRGVFQDGGGGFDGETDDGGCRREQEGRKRDIGRVSEGSKGEGREIEGNEGKEENAPPTALAMSTSA